MFARNQSGQGITEYALMLAIVLVLAYGTVRALSGFAGVRFTNAAKVLQLQHDNE